MDPEATTAQDGQQESRSSSAGKTAIEILRERFARGEIDQKEFQQRLKVLNGR
jgi:uncharacterized membrane protein